MRAGHTVIARREHWMDDMRARAVACGPMLPLHVPLKVEKLSDRSGQYSLTLKCRCGHARQTDPGTLSIIDGWDAHLSDVIRRLRCSRCGNQLGTDGVRAETARHDPP